MLPNLLELVESPYAVVRKAARDSLSEFTFKRFVAAFDMLDEDVRRSTGMLVKKIDPQSVLLLHDELRSPIRTRRLRGLTIARAIDCVESVEGTIVEMLQDEDHLVRMEAAAALGKGVTPAGEAALHQALADTSEVVREAAQRSLQERLPDRRPARRAGKPMSPSASILLAEASRGQSLSESFRSHAGMGRDDVLLGLLMAAALVAGLWAASRLLGLRRRRRGYNSPRQLFRALCKAHHLTWSDRGAAGPPGAASRPARCGPLVPRVPALGRTSFGFRASPWISSACGRCGSRFSTGAPRPTPPRTATSAAVPASAGTWRQCRLTAGQETLAAALVAPASAGKPRAAGLKRDYEPRRVAAVSRFAHADARRAAVDGGAERGIVGWESFERHQGCEHAIVLIDRRTYVAGPNGSPMWTRETWGIRRFCRGGRLRPNVQWLEPALLRLFGRRPRPWRPRGAFAFEQLSARPCRRHCRASAPTPKCSTELVFW